MSKEQDKYNSLAAMAEKEAETLLNSYGFFDIKEEDKNIAKFEEILWDIAKKYALGEVSSLIFDEVCGYYNGTYVYYKLSHGAESLIIDGIELDYYKYIQPNEKELQLLNNGIKKELKQHFGTEIESLFKI